MDVRDLGFVGCRLVALYFGFQALHLVPTVLGAFAFQFTPTGDAGPNVWLLSLSQVIGFAIWVGASIFIWKNARTISSLITPLGSSHSVTAISRGDIQSILFSAIGLIILVHSAGDLADSLYVRYTLKSQGLDPPQIVNYTSQALIAAAKTVIGLFLVFGSSGLVGAIKRFREAGKPSNESRTENDENAR